MKMIIRIFILLFVALNVSMAFAVTEFITTCNKSGEDFNTITLWEDCMDAATDLTDGTVLTGGYDNKAGVNISSGTAVTWDAGGSGGTMIYMTDTQYLIDVTAGSLADNDLVTDGGESSFDVAGSPDSVIITLEVYDDDGDLCENGIIINGFSTNATNFVKITVPEADRHDGTEGTGACIDGGGGAAGVFRVLDAYVQIEWLEIKNFGNGNTFYGIELYNYSPLNYSCQFKNLIVHGGGGTNDDAFRADGVYNNKFINCIAYDCGRGFTSVDHLTFTNYYYNCSVYGSAGSGDSGFATLNSTITCTNCCSFNSAPDWGNVGGGHIINNNCISDDGTADDFAGSNNLVDKVATDNYTDVGSGTEDLHLIVGADCIDAGQDLSGTFTDDIDGVTRTGTWDVGVDQYVSGSPSAGVDDGSRNYFYVK